MRNPSSLVIDCGLSLKGGHHLAHLEGVVRSLQAFGSTVTIITNKMVNVETIFECTVFSVLPFTGYETVDSLDGCFSSDIRLSRVVQGIGLKLACLDWLFEAHSQIVVLNVTPIVAAAMDVWLRLRCNFLKKELALFMLSGVGVGVDVDAASVRLKVLDAKKQQNIRDILTFIGSRCLSLNVYAHSALHNIALRSVFRGNIREYRIQSALSDASGRKKAEEDLHILLYAGDAKAEKGFLGLPKLITDLLKVVPECKLLVHFNDINCRFRVTKSRLLDLAKGHSQVRVVEGFLSASEYANILYRSKLVVLLHEVEYYYDMASGISTECMIGEIPFICREGTVAAAVSKICGMPDRVYRDSDNLCMKISQIFEESSPQCFKAQSCSERFGILDAVD